MVDSLIDTVYVESGECRFVNLTLLIMENVKTDDVFFTNFASQFPKLKDLIIRKFDHGHQNIQLSSRSLKFLSLEPVKDTRIKMFQFDVPNISTFEFLGWNHIPTMSFTTTSKQWESVIKLRDIRCDKHSLFPVELRNLVKNLRQSKISLSIKLHSYKRSIPMINVGNSPLVENLTVFFLPKNRFNFVMALSCLLWSCCPKVMNVYYNGNIEGAQFLLYEKLVKQADKIRHNQIAAQDLRYIYDLKEYSMELYEQSVMEWQPIKTVSDASEVLQYEPDLRLKLTWGRITPEHTIVNFSVIKHYWSV